MTAAAFAKGLLALEGELTPILVQMVKSANTNGLLDNDCESSKFQNMAKNRLHELMQVDREFSDEDCAAINPTNSISINQAINFVKNPVQCCTHVHELIKSLLNIIGLKKDDLKTRDAILYHGESWDLMARRWGKIEKDFSTKHKSFDISKIPGNYFISNLFILFVFCYFFLNLNYIFQIFTIASSTICSTINTHYNTNKLKSYIFMQNTWLIL